MTKFRLIIVHNSKNKNKISFTKQSIVLPNLININHRLKQFLIEDIRKEIQRRVKNIVRNREQIPIAMQ